jgi:hypothetical protein
MSSRQLYFSTPAGQQQKIKTMYPAYQPAATQGVTRDREEGVKEPGGNKVPDLSNVQVPWNDVLEHGYKAPAYVFKFKNFAPPGACEYARADDGTYFCQNCYKEFPVACDGERAALVRKAQYWQAKIKEYDAGRVTVKEEKQTGGSETVAVGAVFDLSQA